MAALLVTFRIIQLIRRPKREGNPAPALAGLTMLLLISLHSLVDYPLRADGLAAAAAVALGFLFSPAQAARSASSEKPKRTRKGFADPMAGFRPTRSASGRWDS
jgi:hypothetical protein